MGPGGGQPLGVALAQQTPEQAQVALERLDAVISAFEELRDTIDRRQFDVEALGLDLAFEDAEGIVEYVRDNISFEQYAGLLRGPRGTLMSRAGNALDQAVLLARLLNDAGYEAVVSVGKIDRTTAMLLVDQMMEPRPSPVPFADLDAVTEILTRLEVDTGLPDGSMTALFAWFLDDPPAVELEEAAAADHAAVMAALESAGVAIGDEDWQEDLVEEATTYAWVEYRLGPDDPWEHAHPAFANADTAPTGLSASETLVGTVPPELQHRLRVESFVERRLGAKITQAPVMDAWEVPVAELIGVPVSYWNAPEALATTTDLSAIDMASVATSSDLLFPLLMGAPPAGAHAFDLLGNTVPAGEAVSPMAGIFQTVGAAAASAASALSEVGEPADADSEAIGLTSQVLRFTFITPGGAEKVFERSVAPVPDDVPASFEALSTERTFMVAAGLLSDGYVLDRILERVIAAAPLIRTSLLLKVDPSQDVPFDPGGLEPSDAWLGHLAIYQAFDAQPYAPIESITYRDAPSMVLRHSAVIPTETSVAVIDVVTNPRRSFSWDGGSLAADPERSVSRGVWETHAETVFALAEDGAVFSTVGAQYAADGSRLPLTVVTPAQAAAVEALAPDDISRQSMLRDLGMGFTLLVPTGLAEGTRAGWWRVDARSGETLGVIFDGSGGVITEALVLSVFMGVVTAGVCFIVGAVGGNTVNDTAWDCLGAGVGVGVAFMAPAIGFAEAVFLILGLGLGFLSVGDVPFPF